MDFEVRQARRHERSARRHAEMERRERDVALGILLWGLYMLLIALAF